MPDRVPRRTLLRYSHQAAAATRATLSSAHAAKTGSGESMFSAAPDASKVALVGLVERLRAGESTLLDVQWVTPHLASLGAVEVPRSRYLELLAEAVGADELEVQ